MFLIVKILIFITGTTKLLVGLTTFLIPKRRKRQISLEQDFNPAEAHEIVFRIIDLNSPATTCNPLQDFPFGLEGAFGGLGFQDKPIICGGYNNYPKYSNLKECYSLEDNGWTSAPGLNTEKVWAAVSPSPYPSGDQRFFVTGGKHDKHNENSSLNTAEVLTEEGWKTLPQTLPVRISKHCSVLVNSTTVMVIGGEQNARQSSDTYLFNTENEVWTEGPKLSKIRSHASCGRIRKDSQSQEFSIIVAGGLDENGTTLSSVEILDLGSNEWRAGPDFPFGIQEAKMVEYQNGEVILVGGISYPANQPIFQLQHGGADVDWTTMLEQMLEEDLGSELAFAFLVPDSIVECK